MNEWLVEARDRLAAAAGREPSELDLTPTEIAAVLEFAGHAAHASGDRTNAPLICYLLGRAQGEKSLDELIAAVERST